MASMNKSRSDLEARFVPSIKPQPELFCCPICAYNCADICNYISIERVSIGDETLPTKRDLNRMNRPNDTRPETNQI